MKIQITKNVAGPLFNYRPGQLVSVPNTIGEQLIAAGSASPIADTSVSTEPQSLEIADAPLPEATAEEVSWRHLKGGRRKKATPQLPASDIVPSTDNTSSTEDDGA